MKVEEFTDKSEVYVLAGVIADPAVLGRVAARWDGRLFASPVANQLAQLAVDYHKAHGRAPGRDIESLFVRWAEQCPDRETVALGERLLGHASSEYERWEEGTNPQHVLDVAGQYFDKVRLGRLQDRIKAGLAAGDVEGARQAVLDYHHVELGVGAGEDLLRDEELIRAAFRRQAEPLVAYPDAVGAWFGPMLARDRLVAYLAPEKTGKSFFLLDLAWRALTQGRRVGFFECGDDPEATRMRFWVRATKHPDRSGTGKWPHTARVPTDLQPPARGADGEPTGCARVEFNELAFEKPLGAGRALKALRRLFVHWNDPRDPPLRMSCHPAKSLSVAGIRAVLEAWALDGWRPDVICVDYADLLAPLDSRQHDVLQQEDDTWAALRALSQELHVLVATATQANRESYGRPWLSREHIGGSKRKLAHVSAMVGINVFGDEKKEQLYRLNWIGRRQGAYSNSDYVHVAHCLALANPCVKSCF